jgi:hypothetical protein
MLDSRDVELSWLVMIMTWKRMDHDHVRSSVLHNTREVEVYGHRQTQKKTQPWSSSSCAPNQLKIIQKTNQPFNGSPLSLQYLLQPKESIFFTFYKRKTEKERGFGRISPS